MLSLSPSRVAPRISDGLAPPLDELAARDPELFVFSAICGMEASRRTSGGGNRRSRVDESRRTSGGATSHRGSTGIAGLWRKASLKARALARLEGAAPHSLTLSAAAAEQQPGRHDATPAVKATLHAAGITPVDVSAPSERASAGAEGSEAPAAVPSPPRSGTRSGTRMRWRRHGGGDPEVARVDAARFTEADLD